MCISVCVCHLCPTFSFLICCFSWHTDWLVTQKIDTKQEEYCTVISIFTKIASLMYSLNMQNRHQRVTIVLLNLVISMYVVTFLWLLSFLILPSPDPVTDALSAIITHCIILCRAYVQSSSTAQFCAINVFYLLNLSQANQHDVQSERLLKFPNQLLPHDIMNL